MLEAGRIVSGLSGEGDDPPEKSDVIDTISGAKNLPSRSSDLSGLLWYPSVYVRIVDSASRHLVAQSQNLDTNPKVVTMLTHDLPPPGEQTNERIQFSSGNDGQALRVLSQSFRLASEPAILQIGVSWQRNEMILDRLLGLLCAGNVVVVSLTALGGWMLVRRTLAPINRIVTQAERLNVDTLSGALLPGPRESDSEVGQLVATLNSMLLRLHTAFEAERSLNLAQQRLAKAQHQFTQDASHELRTPLTVLRGEVEYSLLKPRDSDTYLSTLKSAMSTIDQLCQIVENLDVLARFDGEGGSPRAFEEVVDLSSMCAAIVKSLDLRAGKAGVQLDYTTPAPSGAPVQVHGNEGLLRQVLLNLIENAIKYSDAGGRVRVSTETSVNNAKGTVDAVVSVSDDGIGISAEDLPHIFERFWRAGNAREEQGSGLGLAISSCIAAEHGGAIAVESTFGHGSTFTLSLPAAQSRAQLA